MDPVDEFLDRRIHEVEAELVLLLRARYDVTEEFVSGQLARIYRVAQELTEVKRRAREEDPIAGRQRRR